MTKLRSILIVTLLTSVAALSAAETARDFSGTWLGTLDAGAMKLRVAFNITAAADGGLRATMDSLDQGVRGIPVDGVTVTDTALSMEVKSVPGGGRYEGTLDATGTAINGTWSQGPNSMPLNLTKGAGTAALPAVEELSPADLAASKAAAETIAGIWNGTLVTPGPTLRLRVNISKTAAGAATGTMDSLDQGANGFPLSVITLREGKVRFEVRGVGGVYEGALAPDGATISGTWSQGGNRLPLDLQKAKTE